MTHFLIPVEEGRQKEGGAVRAILNFDSLVFFLFCIFFSNFLPPSCGVFFTMIRSGFYFRLKKERGGGGDPRKHVSSIYTYVCCSDESLASKSRPVSHL